MPLFVLGITFRVLFLYVDERGAGNDILLVGFGIAGVFLLTHFLELNWFLVIRNQVYHCFFVWFLTFLKSFFRLSFDVCQGLAQTLTPPSSL